MIFLSTNSDGKNTEGIGAMVMTQLLCYTLAKKMNIGFYFSKFKNFAHFEYHNMTQDSFMNDINEFFNLPSEINESEVTKKLFYNSISENEILKLKETYERENVLIEIKEKYFLKNSGLIIDYADKFSTIRFLKSCLNLKKQHEYQDFLKTEKNISVHIRKYTKTDCCSSPKRDLFNKSKEKFYIKLLKDISNLYKDENLHFRIYAQGDISEYTFLNGVLDQKDKISFCIEEYPITSLYYMINSDVLVMANSAFSWIAHLYGDHKVTYVKHGFDAPLYKGSVLIGLNGNL
jgi:hypothetical protein